jgi:exopolyphosphatase/guanosine-5'-triphosphate,3'-diphosphate pyrophosphatase
VRVAAVDVGTNTVRLLVRDNGEPVARDSRITRLGQGVDASGELGAVPMQRTLEVVRTFVEQARGAGAERIRIAGTSALRDAKNRSDFADQVRQACGLPLEVLEGGEEGRLAYLGATTWLGDGEFVVCDIGGGSTELITAHDVVSADIGSVRVRERYLEGDPPTAASVDRARTAILGIFVGLNAPSRFERGRLVGVAGTITTIAALDTGLEVYDHDVVHGYRISREGVVRWADELNRLTAEEIRGLGPVAPGRADVIGAGALVLEAVVTVLRRESVLVSERDILDGLVADLVG